MQDPNKTISQIQAISKIFFRSEFSARYENLKEKISIAWLRLIKIEISFMLKKLCEQECQANMNNLI